MQANHDIAPDKGALRKTDAAAFVGLPVSSWDRMVKSGTAPRATYVSPRRPVWPKETLLNWLRDLGHKQGVTVDPKRKKRKNPASELGSTRRARRGAHHEQRR